MNNTNPVVVELNDSGLICHYEGQKIISPGYALLTKKGVTTGEEARARAWLDPQKSFNQYWHQLSMAPLGIAHSHARHHADLAYAQLQQLLEQLSQAASKKIASSPLIFSVPGNFSHQQLSIVLGLAKACGHETNALVDNALCALACGDQQYALNTGPLVHLDILLHNALLTTFKYSLDTANKASISRQAVLPLNGLGLKHFEDRWVQAIANRFIKEYRYDPLHTAAGEQTLRNQLPEWLTSLRNDNEIVIHLPTAKGELQLSLLREDFIEANRDIIETLTHAVSKALSGKEDSSHQASDCLFISHRIAALPGILQHLPNASCLSSDNVIKACLSHDKNIIHPNGEVSLITSLPLEKKHSPNTGTSQERSVEPQFAAKVISTTEATHLLYRHRAHPIGEGLMLKPLANELAIQPLTQDMPHSQNHMRSVAYLNNSAQGLQLTAENLEISCSGNLNALKSGDNLSLKSATDTKTSQTFALELINVLT